jgi:structural maintenance of chromosome 4
MEAEAPAAAPHHVRRLMIRQMVLDNFKSYAGPVSVGPFDKVTTPSLACDSPFALACILPPAVFVSHIAQSFSSVVGPNGSGKSNVIDALLFVFGRRAKQVRVCADRRVLSCCLVP